MAEKMKAYVLHGISNLRYEEIEKPHPLHGEVLVRVKAAGICGSDIPRIYQTGAYHHPMIPGHEFSGQVEEIGEGVDEQWLGKRVGIFPLIPCGKCPSCKRKQYEMCSRYNYLGSRTDGGFAEYVRVPEWNLLELPERVTFEQAAMLEPMAVAVHAIRQSNFLREVPGTPQENLSERSLFFIPGESPIEKNIAVCGLGTIGLFVIMFLRSMGCRRVYAVGNKDFQRKAAEKLGVAADHYCDTRSEDCVKWLTDRTEGEGVDLFFECVGKNEVLTQGVGSIAPGGTLILVGNPSTDMLLEKTVYWKLLRRQITVRGTWNSSFTHEDKDDWHFVLDLLERGRIHPEDVITHRFLMKALMNGFELMRDKSEDYIKVLGEFL